MEYKSLFTCLFLCCPSCNSYIKWKMFQTIWFITRDFLSFQPGSCNIPYKKPTQTQPLMINPTVWNMSGTVYRNYNKHSRWIRQSAMPVNTTVQQYVLVNTKVSYLYLSAIPSVSFSYYTLRSHIKHTVCLCVSCYYICRKVTHNWQVTYFFHLALYILL